MKAPRSIYVAFEVFPRPKGAGSHIGNMVQALAAHHAPVWLVCLGVGDLPAFQDEGDIIIHRCKFYHPGLLRRAQAFAEFVTGIMAAARSRAELLVFRDPWGGCPALAGLPKIPGVFEVNALPSWELPYTYPALSRNAALLTKLEDLERYCLLVSDRVLTVSRVTAEALAELGVPMERMDVIPNCAADSFFQADGATALPELDQGEWFGYIGSLHPWQGVETVIDAFALAAPALPYARFLLLTSSGKEQLKLLSKRIRKRGLEEHVCLRQSRPQNEIPAILRRLRFTVAPLRETSRNTRQGCCPVKIIESMAVGTPVLASSLRVCRELIHSEHDGLLLPPHQPRAWARAILRLFSEPGLAARLGQAAQEKARQCFSPAAVFPRLEACFRTAQEQCRRRQN